MQITTNNKFKFHHKQGPQNHYDKGTSRLEKEALKKTTSYGSYVNDEVDPEKSPKTHKKNKERNRC